MGRVRVTEDSREVRKEWSVSDVTLRLDGVGGCGGQRDLVRYRRAGEKALTKTVEGFGPTLRLGYVGRVRRMFGCLPCQ